MPATGDRGDADGRRRHDIRIVTGDHDGFAGDAVWCPAMQICWQTTWEALNGGKPMELPWLTGIEAMSMEVMSEHPYDESKFASGRMCSFAGEISEAEQDAMLSSWLGREHPVLGGCEIGDNPDSVSLCAAPQFSFSFYEGFDTRGDASESPAQWTFGTEWHGNVARHVTYAYADDPGQMEHAFPLFYDDFDRNAVAIGTLDGDLAVLTQGLVGTTVAELWEDLVRHSAESETPKTLDADGDTLSFPVIGAMLKRTHPEWALEEVESEAGSLRMGRITHAIGFVLDADGCGTVSALPEAAPADSKPEAEPEATDRSFDYSDDFILFLVDGEACRCYSASERPVTLADAYPYFAVSVHDITCFQDGAERLVDYDPLWGTDIDTGNTVTKAASTPVDETEGAGDNPENPSDGSQGGE